MIPLDYPSFHTYLAEHVITPFYEVRFKRLNELQLKKILSRKNPYLFKAKNIELAQDLVKGILDAHLSSQEETMIGNLLEGFAIFVSETLYGGYKPERRKSVDLEFRRDDVYYIVGIKSGPFWGNRDQIAQMKSNFKLARVELRSEGVLEEVVAVNGCIYGKDRSPFKSDSDPEKSYYKRCGQDFWTFVSGDEELYREIITPIDEQAKERDAAFKAAYAAKINEMTEDFMENFVSNHQIDWIKLLDFVSKKDA